MTNKLARWNPFLEPFEDMERTFSELMPALRGDRESYMPAIDMYEDKDNVIVEAQLAGMDPENVDLAIENDVLTIKGESEKKNEVEDKNYYRKEIKRGSFYRNIPMPTPVEDDKAKAVVEEGVLKVTIPKASQAKSTSIKIEKKGKKE
ncbi:MAG TPA: Hsp20/alpha crystallin family protein [Patescibacteria group bacterium]|nr:Hsp20/alpha crystallin family protein [Patescibacteria group bacterium]